MVNVQSSAPPAVAPVQAQALKAMPSAAAAGKSAAPAPKAATGSKYNLHA